MENENGQIEAIEQMLKTEKSEKLLMHSFDIFFHIKRDNIISRIIIILFSAVFALSISLLDTVIVMRDISSTMLDVAIAVFGIVFTGYTLFQAVLNREIISIFMQDIKKGLGKKKNSNTLHITNWNFVQLMLQFAVMIFINLLLKIILTIMPAAFQLFEIENVNIIISTMLLFVYFYQAMVILWRLIGFLHNIYHIFNAYAVSEYLESVGADKKK